MALDMARKISFKPTSRRSSHGRTARDRLARHWTRDCALQSIYPGDTGFRHPQVRKNRRSRAHPHNKQQEAQVSEKPACQKRHARSGAAKPMMAQHQSRPSAVADPRIPSPEHSANSGLFALLYIGYMPPRSMRYLHLSRSTGILVPFDVVSIHVRLDRQFRQFRASFSIHC